MEAALLNATPGATMHIEVPEMMIKTGMITQEEADKIALLLMKSMHGNIDAALRFFLMMKDILINKLQYEPLVSEPCVFVHRDSEGVNTVDSI